MHDNLRQYRAIRGALTQGYPSEPTGRMARHVTTLAALISGLVASKRTQLPQVAAHMPDDTKLENRIKRFARWVGNSTVTEEVSFVLYIHGAGQTRDDAEVVRWFHQAADLRHSYALANLGRMYWDGRGGLAVDRAEAVRLWRRSAYYENPFGRLYLAEALEQGDGIARNTQEALELYRAVAAQDAEPAVKRRASEALARLGASTPR